MGHVTFGKKNPIEKLFTTAKRRANGSHNNVNRRVAIGSLMTIPNPFAIWYE
jgi:hypothetical protein